MYICSMKAIFTFLGGLFSTIVVFISICDSVFTNGKWRQTYYGMRGGNLCYEYTMKTKDMEIIRTEYYKDVASCGELIFESIDTLYIK